MSWISSAGGGAGETPAGEAAGLVVVEVAMEG
jgi:hypothetical protein